MSGYKCASCGGAKDVKAYVVNTKQILCRACVGRLHFPGTKEAEFDIEELDVKHPYVQSLTGILLQSSVVLGMSYALWHSGIGDDYFNGASTCPTLSRARQALARFDANVFYYYKSSLATYCDIEDSFWRLLLDGWVRGVVSGSDSFLLVLSTLPKAFLFKSAVNTLLKPVYGLLYALAGLILSSILFKIQDAVKWVFDHFPTRLTGYFQTVVRSPAKLQTKVYTKNPALDMARKLFLAMSVSALLRLAVHLGGFHRLAALGSSEADVWQLLFEPVAYYAVALVLASVGAKLDKTLWKKAPPAAPVVPPTLWRKKPMKDVTELVTYARARFWRCYEAYQKQAGGLLSIVVDDVFNAVVAFRLLNVALGASPYLRAGLSFLGLGTVVEHHASWFREATGFMQDGGKYLSDRLFNFGVGEAVLGLQVAQGSIDVPAVGQFFKEEVLSGGHTVVWRLLVPVVAYLLLQRWEKLLKKQQAAYKKAWKGTDWRNGLYAEMLANLGTFWNMAKAKEEWNPPAEAYPQAAK